MLPKFASQLLCSTRRKAGSGKHSDEASKSDSAATGAQAGSSAPSGQGKKSSKKGSPRQQHQPNLGEIQPPRAVSQSGCSSCSSTGGIVFGGAWSAESLGSASMGARRFGHEEAHHLPSLVPMVTTPAKPVKSCWSGAGNVKAAKAGKSNQNQACSSSSSSTISSAGGKAAATNSHAKAQVIIPPICRVNLSLASPESCPPSPTCFSMGFAVQGDCLICLSTNSLSWGCCWRIQNWSKQLNEPQVRPTSIHVETKRWCIPWIAYHCQACVAHEPNANRFYPPPCRRMLPLFPLPAVNARRVL